MQNWPVISYSSGSRIGCTIVLPPTFVCSYFSELDSQPCSLQPLCAHVFQNWIHNHAPSILCVLIFFRFKNLIHNACVEFGDGVLPDGDRRRMDHLSGPSMRGSIAARCRRAWVLVREKQQYFSCYLCAWRIFSCLLFGME